MKEDEMNPIADGTVPSGQPLIGSTTSIIKLHKIWIRAEEFWQWSNGLDVVSPDFDSLQCAIEYGKNVRLMTKDEWWERPLPIDIPTELLPAKIQGWLKQGRV